MPAVSEIANAPVSLRDRIWIERRIGWLVERLGRNRMAAVPKALPVAEDFPIPYDGTEASIQEHFRRIAGWMGVDVTCINLASFERRDAPYASGLYQVDEEGTKTIWYEESSIRDPESLVATLAHELSHEVLLGGTLLSGNEKDDEELTDLTAIFLGMGVFIANAALKDYTFEYRTHSTTVLSRAGYLNAVQGGYALAVLAWMGRITDLSWTRWLRPDQQSAVRHGLDYLTNLDDHILDRDHPTRPVHDPNSFSELVDWLNGSSDARRMQALFRLDDLRYEIPRAEPNLLGLLDSNKPSIRQAALSLLAELEQPWTSAAFSSLAKIASADDPMEFRSALQSLAKRPLPPNFVLANRVTWAEHLENQLRDPDRRFAVDAAEAIAALAPNVGERMLVLLQDLFVEAVIRCNLPADRLWRALERMLPDARAVLLDRVFRRSPALVDEVEHFWQNIDAAENPPDFDAPDVDEWDDEY